MSTRAIVERKTLFGTPVSSDAEVLAGIQRVDDEEREYEDAILADAAAIRRRRRGDPKGIRIPIAS